MDLEQKLKSLSPELSDCLRDIKKACTEIWKSPLLVWFTNHDVKHSNEIANNKTQKTNNNQIQNIDDQKIAYQ